MYSHLSVEVYSVNSTLVVCGSGSGGDDIGSILCSSSSVVSGNAGSESGRSSVGSRCSSPMVLVVIKLTII